MAQDQPRPAGSVRSPGIPEYIKLRRSIGWVVICIVAFSFLFLARSNLSVMLVLLLLAAVYNTCLYSWTMIRQKWLASKLAILIIDSAFIILVVAYSDAVLKGPYTSLLLFPIISSAMWFGAVASLATASLELAGTVFWVLAISGSDSWQEAAKNFAFRMIIFALIGIYLAYLTRQERMERSVLASKDLQIDQERQQLLALINNIGDAVLIVDHEGKINLFNEMTARLTGSEYALVGKQVNTVFPFFDDKDQSVELLAVTSTGTMRRRDLKLKLKDTSTINVEADISPYIVNKQSRGFIIILRDITKEKTLEEEQEEFISVASHELRTPLTIAEASISNSLASPNAPTDPTVRGLLSQAESNIRFLSNIINDLTTLSRAQQDSLDVDLNPLDPAALVHELANEFTDRARAHGLTVIVNVPSEVKPILTSRYRIKQILQNFVTNAIKYTSSGSITISVENAPREQDGVVFSVSDTGIGISVSDQKKLFGKFFRSEDYKTRESSGTGLGLYISAKLAQRLSGKIWFESELKKGSTFFLQVPPYSKLKKDHTKVVKAEMESFFGAF